MKILPYDSFTISTPDSVTVVVQRLDAKIEVPFLLGFSTKDRPYQGTVSEQGFKITRKVYRKLFIPVIKGRFEVQSHQTVVSVEMSLHHAAIGFLGFFCLSWYSVILPNILQSAATVGLSAIFPAILPIFLIIVWLSFWSEVSRSRSELANIIQGNEDI